MMPDRNVLVIAGMHRSGTSLVASMAQQAGVMIGDELLAPNRGNPRGYFEDTDFLELHDAMLRRAGQGVLVRNRSLLGPARDEDVETARRLIASRGSHELWGFKDPRATLFLDFWEDLLDDARYLLLYRHPVDVVLSLRRRAADADVLADPATGFEAWEVYNACLLDFYRRHPERCFLADVYGVVAAVDGFVAALRKKTGLCFDTAACRDLVVPRDLRRSVLSSAHRDVLRRLEPEVVNLFEDLARTADLPDDTDELPSQHDRETESLGALAERWTADEKLRAAGVSPLLSLLLARVDPELGGRSRELLLGLLAEDREKRHELESELVVRSHWAIDLDRQLLELRAEFDERTEQAMRLEAQVRQQEQRIRELEARLGDDRRRSDR